MAIHAVEKLAGKEHYRHFKRYIQFGGMDHLMEGCSFTKEFRFHQKATGIRIYALD
jgi:hypothetical protein